MKTPWRPARYAFAAVVMTVFVAGCRTTPRNQRVGQTPFIVEELRTASRFSDGYCGWPTVARRQDGELVLVYSGGREAHVCPFGRVEMMVSQDNGLDWSSPRVLIDTPIDDRDAGVLETRKGTLLVTTFTSLAYESVLEQAIKSGSWSPERIQAWRQADERLPADERDELLGQWMIRSEDGGQSWSPMYRCIVDSPHGPIQLSDGRLLYAGKELWTGARRVGFCESRDDGRSWQWLATLPVRPGDLAAEYHELHVVEAPSGRLIAQIRNQNPNNQGETLQSESLDDGLDWTTPHSIGVWGLPSHLLCLRDGRLLMTYGHRRPPYGVQARTSDDEGRSWSSPMIIYGDGSGTDLGYPFTVELGGNELLTVWYELPAGSTHAVLKQARWWIGGK